MFSSLINADKQWFTADFSVLKVIVLLCVLSLTKNLNNTIFPVVFMNEVSDVTLWSKLRPLQWHHSTVTCPSSLYLHTSLLILNSTSVCLLL